jgi:hypothetical protein
MTDNINIGAYGANVQSAEVVSTFQAPTPPELFYVEIWNGLVWEHHTKSTKRDNAERLAEGLSQRGNPTRVVHVTYDE